MDDDLVQLLRNEVDHAPQQDAQKIADCAQNQFTARNRDS